MNYDEKMKEFFENEFQTEDMRYSEQYGKICGHGNFSGLRSAQ